MVHYCAVEGVDIVHAMYNLHSVSLKESIIWFRYSNWDSHVTVLSSSRTHPTDWVCVHSAHVQGQQPWDPLPILRVKWLMVPMDLFSPTYKLTPNRGL